MRELLITYWWQAASVAVCAAALCLWLLMRWYNSPRRRGLRCEKKVRHALMSLRRRDYVVFNDLMIPSSARNAGEGAGRHVQIDHLVVSTRGIFVIETKGHVGHIQGSENAQYWDQRFWMSARSFYNPLLQNDSHVRALRRSLRGVPASWFVSVVVFTEAWRIDVLTDDMVCRRRWLPDRHIKRTLDPERVVRRRWWRRERGVVLDESKMVMRLSSLVRDIKRRPAVTGREEMEAIAEKVRALDIRDRGERRRHPGYVKEVARRKEREIREGICPRCGAPLVLRQGDYGPFYGCSSYPSCRFVCSAESSRFK